MKRPILLLTLAFVATTNICAAQNRETRKEIDSVINLIREGHAKECVATVDSLLKLYPQNSDLLYIQASYEYVWCEYEESIANYTKAIENCDRKSRFDKDILYYDRGNTYMALREYDLAIADFSEALRHVKRSEKWVGTYALDKRAECHFRLQDYEASAKDLVMILKKSKDMDSVASAVRNLCDVCMAAEKYDAAIEAAMALLELDAYHDTAFATLIDANLMLEEYDTAIDIVILYVINMREYGVYETLTERMEMVLLYNVDYVKQILSDYIAQDVEHEYAYEHALICDAVKDYDTLLQLMPYVIANYGEENGVDEATSAEVMSVCYALAGRYEEAAAILTELMVPLEGEDYLYSLLCKRCEYYYNAGEYEKSIADAERLLEAEGDSGFLYSRIGQCYEHMGDMERAMQYYSDGVAVDDSYPAIYLKRGEHYLKAGDVERATADFERVLELDTEVVFDSVRQYALHLLGRDEEAKEWMDVVLEECKYSPEANYEAACLYALIGDVDMSLEYLFYALQLGYRSKANIENNSALDPIRDTEIYERMMNDFLN